MSEELKPCPFCASDNIVFEEFYGNSGFFVCVDCGMESGVFDDKEAAVKAWNTRAAGWIKTSERLPEDSNNYLVTYKNKFIFIGNIAKYIGAGGVSKVWFVEKHEAYSIDFIPLADGWYWMPLPELPEVGE